LKASKEETEDGARSVPKKALGGRAMPIPRLLKEKTLET
jgi:hypothetical protein